LHASQQTQYEYRQKLTDDGGLPFVLGRAACFGLLAYRRKEVARRPRYLSAILEFTVFGELQMNSRLLITSFALLASVQTVSAAVVTSLSDNFTMGETPALNWTGDSVFVPVPNSPATGQPSVDLVSPTTYPTLVPNSGNAPSAIIGLNAVDLDGSTGTGFTPSGVLQSVNNLAAGSYEVTFYLAGNLRGAPAQVTDVTLGNQTISLGSIPNTQNYTLYSLIFSDVSQGTLSFTDLGPATQQGTLLTDVTVSAVPEPATWVMMILGFVGLSFMAYRRKRPLALAPA
jgi:PEP-CTERM motif